MKLVTLGLLGMLSSFASAKLNRVYSCDIVGYGEFVKLEAFYGNEGRDTVAMISITDKKNQCL
jgi:hypothetical protein